MEIRGMTWDDKAREQLELAINVARIFLTKPYVRPLAAETLEKTKIVIESSEGGNYEGPSFGLALLAGCLSIGLNVPLRQKQLFTAALGGGIESVGMPGGGIKLGPVGETGAKLAAACLERRSRLYLRSKNERETLHFEQGFWRGEIDRSCFPYTLPENLSTAAVVAASLDAGQLLKKASSSEDGTAFLLLLFVVGGELHNGASVVDSIGSTLALLRGEGRLRNVRFLRELIRDLGIKNADTAEHLLLRSFGSFIAACSTDAMRGEAVKSVISSNPTLPLFSQPDVDSHPVESGRADLDLWLDREVFNSLGEFVYGLQVLRVCSQMAPDPEAYWPRIKRLVLGSLSSYLDYVIQLVERGQVNDAANLLVALCKCNLGNSIGRLNADFVGETKDLVGSAKKRLGSIGGSEQLLELISKLNADFARYKLPEALIAIEEKQKPALRLTFQLTGRRNSRQRKRKEAVFPRPPLPRINDIELTVAGPQDLSLCVPSPVLLFEHCREQHYSFCRRRDMTLADDTLSRYPENDATAVWDLYKKSDCHMVGFQVLADDEARPASVRWLSDVNQWPPAIDSQFLAASVVSAPVESKPKRLVDVGCGTGFLAIVAAHHWPSLQELNLLDIDGLAVAAAQTNVSEDPIAGELKTVIHWQAFRKFSQKGFDILLCAPPYLPDRPLPVSGIEVSTNGTALLEEVVQRGYQISRELWMVFSVLAWPEFQRTLAGVPKAYRSIEILRREFVPFRIHWLEPQPTEDGGSEVMFVERRKYYENVLAERGLIDMDEQDNWSKYLDDFSPVLPSNCSASFSISRQQRELENTLDLIKKHSRGYRFWHEIRVVRLISA